MDDTYIPIIDIGALRRGDAAGSRRIAAQLERACSDTGFFCVVGHGVPQPVIDAAFQHAKSFFALPVEQKMMLSLEHYSDCFRGYAPVLSELADGKRNAYELMEFSVEFAADHPDVRAGKPMHGPNLWPALPGYRAAITQYIEQMIGLGFDLMRGIAISLGLREDFFRLAFNDRPFWQFRTAHYPAPDELARMAAALPRQGPLAQTEIGDHSCGAHTDYGCLTILLADYPGLEILTRAGHWIDAPTLPGAYVCNIGDMLQYWTRDRYVATRHRVSTSEERISLPFFFQPDYDTWVVPLDIGSSDKVFPAVQYGPYAFGKYQGIYPQSSGGQR
ncbi:isopenicillin N synthase family dioxygenase [Paraburkholderia solisilvae]|uniref:2-oxoglutarate-dependent ethylene/succinate-forming enzyme n=1 Tax=Paraburkholderia solisilvae TaxID=624376 RepID=A0A6J5DZZ6_9BURK|nr:isopenicillin N synthase family oxygenase [Paraburkholderia solisilvae]CAB3759623.1 Validamycin A dioxygenase [Paraburkholderia solisilvae]